MQLSYRNSGLAVIVVILMIIIMLGVWIVEIFMDGEE